MEQMNKKILIIMILSFTCQASANSLGIISVDIVPNSPTNTDLITFNISGGASTASSWVESDSLTLNGDSIQLDLYVDRGILRVISYWNYSKQINPLNSATYSLQIRAIDAQIGSPFYGTVQDTYTTSFNVTPEPATIILLGVGALLARKKAVR